MDIPNWCLDQDEVLHFARVLHEMNEFTSIEDVFYYFEKPYKWDPEHQRYEQLGRPEDLSGITTLERGPGELLRTS